ncbi:MAG: hypothetical protein NTV57_07365, partial [Cyanobacteria bacterium]|nr:hypothetical protein [Cyanobacteriota bacterium]
MATPVQRFVQHCKHHGLRVCRKTISQHQFSTATTDFFLFSVDRWLYLPAEGSISALFREFVS